MKRVFKKGEEIFAWNYLEKDLNGFGVVLQDTTTEDDTEVLDVQLVK